MSQNLYKNDFSYLTSLDFNFVDNYLQFQFPEFDQKYYDPLASPTNPTSFTDDLHLPPIQSWPQFQIGDKFFKLSDFFEKLKAYSRSNFCEFKITDSKKLTSQLKWTPTVCENPNFDLKYYYIKVSCAKVKRRKNSNPPTIGQMPDDVCPAEIYLKITRSGKYLEILKMIETHSHPCSAS